MTIESEAQDYQDTDASSRNRESNPEDFVVVDNRYSVIPWTAFTVPFKSGIDRFSSIEQICEANRNKVIDLRPYIESRPYTCFQKDSLQKVVTLFRLMNLRQLPVLDERRGSELTGLITRQDLFQYMKL